MAIKSYKVEWCEEEGKWLVLVYYKAGGYDVVGDYDEEQDASDLSNTLTERL